LRSCPEVEKLRLLGKPNRRSNVLPDTNKPNPIILSVRLGWLVVESFGRLHRWTRTGRIPDTLNREPTRRFTFSDRDPVLYEQLLISLRHLQEVASQLLPDLPPPIPDDPENLLQTARENTIVVWEQFEDWSRSVWNTLQVGNPLAGQAFSDGASLADTYWHAQVASPDKLKALLRPQRLESIAERFNALNQYLPDHTSSVMHYSLSRWREASIGKLDDEQKKHLLARLESQTRVWRNLLFEQMRAEDYLTAKDRSAIGRGAFIATIVLTVLVGLFAWLAVLLLSWLGRLVLEANPTLLGGPAGTVGGLADELLSWQNWTTLLATLSSVVVILSGFITRMSGWMITFYRRLISRFTIVKIHRRTFIQW
jgi:hypothetical protein